MKIALIDPNQDSWSSGKFCRHSQLEPLGLEYIAATLLQSGYEVKIFHQDKVDDSDLINQVVMQKPDLIGFGTFTYNFKAACKIARELKKKLADSRIIFGGHHVTACPEDIIGKPIDYAIYGEGEHSFLELAMSLENGTPPNDIDGIIVNDGIDILRQRK